MLQSMHYCFWILCAVILKRVGGINLPSSWPNHDKDKSNDPSARFVILEKTVKLEGSVLMAVGKAGEEFRERKIANGFRVTNLRMSVTCNSKLGIICWIQDDSDGGEEGKRCGNEEVDYNRIRCIQNGSQIFSYVSPVARTRNERIWETHIQLDPVSKTLYWREPTRSDIWATSLETSSSRLVVRRFETENQQNWFFFFVNTVTGRVYWEPIPLLGIRVARLFDDFTVSQSRSDEIPDQPASSYPNRGMTMWGDGMTLFVMRDNTIEAYEPEGLLREGGRTDGVIRSLRHDSPSSQQLNYLQYWNDRLYWISENNSITSMDIETREMRTEMAARTNVSFTFAIYESRRGDEIQNRDPCSNLNCSHLCIPYLGVYTCVCPADMFLINNSTCAYPILAFNYDDNFKNLTSFHQRTNSSTFAYTTCQDLSAQRRESIYHDEALKIKSIFSANCHFQDVLKRIGPFGSNALMGLATTANVLLDPFGINLYWMRHPIDVRDVDCVNVISMNNQNHSSAPIFCLNDYKALIHEFDIDFKRWIIFWEVHRKEEKYAAILGTSLRNMSIVYKVPISDSSTLGFAINSEEERLYWLDTNKQLTVTQYDGNQQTILVKLSNNRILSWFSRLVYMQNSLYYLESWAQPASHRSYEHPPPNNSITAYNLETTQMKTIAQAPPNIRDPKNLRPMVINDFVLLPPLPPPPHPCASSPCSHICLTLSFKESQCACPTHWTLDRRDKSTCKYTSLLTIESKYGQPATIHYRTGSDKPPKEYPLQEKFPGLRLVRGGPSHRLCWESRSNYSDYFQCFESGKISFLRKPPTASKDALFWDFGHDKIMWWTQEERLHSSCFRLTSYKTNSTITFPCLNEFIPNHELVTFDTARSIIIWLGVGRLKFKALSTEGGGGSLRLVEEENGIFRLDGLAIDVVGQKLFFVRDKVFLGITYTDLFAQRHRVTTHLQLQDYSAIGLQYYRDNLYFINIEGHVMVYNLLNQGDETAVRKNGFRPIEYFQIHIEEGDLSETPWSNSCDSLNCSHFCFPRNPLSSLASTAIFACFCPDGLVLIADRICQDPPSERWTLSEIFSWAFGSLTVVLALGAVVAVSILRDRKKTQLKQISIELKKGNPEAAKAATSPADRAKYLPLTCIISPNDLTVNKEDALGSGYFGVVFRGTFRGGPVAVKTLKSTLKMSALVEFVREIKLMDYIGYHQNIVRFHGAEITGINNRVLYVVLELSPFGSLLNFLRSSSTPAPKPIEGVHVDDQGPSAPNFPEPPTEPRTEPQIPIKTCFYWAKQLAEAMRYLESKHVFHGDLAARNILVFHQNIIKLSDFGLSRNLYQDLNYTKSEGGPMPWRWMAIESLKLLEFSLMSDVWAYAVIMWEIFTCGQVPYPEQQRCSDAFITDLVNGFRLTRPESMPTHFYENILQPSWIIDPEQRPTFTAIIDYLDVVPISEDYNCLGRNAVQYE